MADSSQHPADEDLVDSACGGDDAAFELLMRRHSGAVRRLISRFFGNATLVDDLAQETFVKAYFGLKSFRKESALESWLKRIAVRLCIDQIRKGRSRAFELDEEQSLISEIPAGDDSAARTEAKLLLDKMLKALSPLDRTIVTLLYGEGCSVENIADMTGLSKANIKVRGFRIRRRLRSLYQGGCR